MTELERNFQKFKKITREEFFIAEEIKKHVEIKDTDTILDVGCADGNLSKSLTKDSTNITFLDVDEFNFSPQEKFIRSSFEEVELGEKFDLILSSHVWGHFYRNNTFGFCFKKAHDLLKEGGKLIVVHNSNKDFTGKLIEFSKTLFDQIEFDVFLDEFLEGADYEESYFDVNLKAETFRELAELVQVLLVVPDAIYYSKIEEMTRFLEANLEKPEFAINQRLLVIKKKG
ncbi:MAG: putative methyltransferase [Parcubacteria group bacterium]|nr:putative methyltransferase [Parcubacteria group bacterium]